MSRQEDACALRASVARSLGDDGLTQRQTAKRLKRSQQIVSYHARCLLAKGVLRLATGGRAGQFTTYARGGRWDLFVEAVRGDKEADRRLRSDHRTLMVAHRGHRAFPVKAAPADVAKSPGYEKTARPSGVPTHYLRHQDSSGRAWRIQHSQGKYRQSVIVYPPKLALDDPATVADLVVWWDDFVEKEAHRWAAAAGFVLESRARRAVAPIEVAMHVPGMTKQGAVGIDAAVVDGTPWRDGSLESSPEVMAAVARLPDTVALVGALARRLAILEAAVAAAGLQASPALTQRAEG